MAAANFDMKLCICSLLGMWSRPRWFISNGVFNVWSIRLDLGKAVQYSVPRSTIKHPLTVIVCSFKCRRSGLKRRRNEVLQRRLMKSGGRRKSLGSNRRWWRVPEPNSGAAGLLRLMTCVYLYIVHVLFWNWRKVVQNYHSDMLTAIVARV